MIFKQKLELRELTAAENAVAASVQAFELAAQQTDLSWGVCTLNGDPTEILRDAATEHDAIILSHDACFAMERNAEDLAPCVENLIKLEPRPVIVLPSGGETFVSWEGPALLAFDGSASSSRALHFFAALGFCAGRTVHVVTAAPTLGQAETIASAACRLLSRYDCPDARAIGTLAEGAASTSARILDIAKAVGATTLAMGAYGHQGFKTLFGSCTRRLIQDSRIPIFLVH
ncbi:universal stress protein [Alsobacter metallidurans]|nr:universal stress protein [Alsobacter metallidurans]